MNWNISKNIQNPNILEIESGFLKRIIEFNKNGIYTNELLIDSDNIIEYNIF